LSGNVKLSEKRRESHSKKSRKNKKAGHLPATPIVDPNYILSQGVAGMKEGTLKATIDLMDHSKLCIIKDGQLIEYVLPEYGELTLTIHQGKVCEIKTTTKTRI
jgi:hypothetical protein